MMPPKENFMSPTSSGRTRSGFSGKQLHAKKGLRISKGPASFRFTPSVSLPALLDSNERTDHRFRQFLYDFSTLGASLEIVRSYFASLSGLTPPQYNILMVLANTAGTNIGVSDVARRLHVSTAFITAEGMNLESRGLIEKRRNPNDGRGVLLHLTSLGWRRVEQIGAERQKINDNLFGSLSAPDFRHLADTLASLLDDFSYTVRLIRSVSTEGQPPVSLLRKNTKASREKR
jgi:DNA-binding MarR family transcriptional regulator